MLFLWERRAQRLVMCKIDLVLLLLLLIFRDTLLLYCRDLLLTITATDIPARRNTTEVPSVTNDRARTTKAFICRL